MALWGITDNLAGAPKWLTTTESFVAGDVTTGTNTITIAGHGIPNGSKVVLSGATTNSLGSNTDGVHFAKVVGDAIQFFATFTAPSTFGSAVGISAASAGTIQIIPSDVDVAFAKSAAPKANIFFVDEAEAETTANRNKGLRTPGWYKFETYADAAGVTRQKAELLCAIGQNGHAGQTDTGVDTEATEDSVVAGGNTAITITGQVTNITVANGVTDADAFNVTATVTDSAQYTVQWQESTDGGVTFTNFGNPSALTNSGTQVNLAITADHTDGNNGYKYRAILSSASADDVTSAVGTLTTTA